MICSGLPEKYRRRSGLNRDRDGPHGQQDQKYGGRPLQDRTMVNLRGR